MSLNLLLSVVTTEMCYICGAHVLFQTNQDGIKTNTEIKRISIIPQSFSILDSI